MYSALSPLDFVGKWRRSTLNKDRAAQEHFVDLCQLVGHLPPASLDPHGTWFVFDARTVGRSAGEPARIDVWKKDFFAWEYRAKKNELQEAHQQLLQAFRLLGSPPLLITCNFERIEIHTKFSNDANRQLVLTLDDLLLPEGLEALRAVFFNPRLLLQLSL